MKYAGSLLLLICLSTSLGCVSLCDSCPDGKYNAYGGLRERHDQVNGRVGSVFDPAAAAEAPPVVEETLPPVERDTPRPGGTDNPDPPKSELRDLIKQMDELDDLPAVPNTGGEPAPLDEV